MPRDLAAISPILPLSQISPAYFSGNIVYQAEQPVDAIGAGQCYFSSISTIWPSAEPALVSACVILELTRRKSLGLKSSANDFSPAAEVASCTEVAATMRYGRKCVCIGHVGPGASTHLYTCDSEFYCRNRRSGWYRWNLGGYPAYGDLTRDCIQEPKREFHAIRLHFVLFRSLMAIEMPMISLVSHPVGRFTDCNR